MKRDKLTFFPDSDGWEKVPSNRTVSVYAIFYDIDYELGKRASYFTITDSDIQTIVHMGTSPDLRRREGNVLLDDSDIDFTTEGHNLLNDLQEIYGHEPAIALIRS